MTFNAFVEFLSRFIDQSCDPKVSVNATIKCVLIALDFLRWHLARSRASSIHSWRPNAIQWVPFGRFVAELSIFCIILHPPFGRPSIQVFMEVSFISFLSLSTILLHSFINCCPIHFSCWWRRSEHKQSARLQNNARLLYTHVVRHDTTEETQNWKWASIWHQWSLWSDVFMP